MKKFILSILFCVFLNIGTVYGFEEIEVPYGHTFPDPIPVNNPNSTINEKVGDDYVFFSTHNKMLKMRDLSGNQSSIITGIDIDYSFIEDRINLNKLEVHPFLWAKSVYYDPDFSCNWHMLASVQLKKKQGSTVNWPAPYKTIIVHLSPNYESGPGGEGHTCAADNNHANEEEEFNRINGWIVDDVLVGNTNNSYGYNDFANYDAKYLRDDETNELYMVYVKRLPNFRNGIVAQKMNKPRQKHNSNPITLLAPERRLKSELRNAQEVNNPNALMLLEGPSIKKLNNNQYVLSYTVGDYQRKNYKIALAYSNSLLGPYTKNLMYMNLNPWGSRNYRDDVSYILRSEKPRLRTDIYRNAVARVNGPKEGIYTPDYRIVAPGIGVIIKDNDGTYRMTFAGYNEVDGVNVYNPEMRRMFSVPLSFDFHSPYDENYILPNVE